MYHFGILKSRLTLILFCYAFALRKIMESKFNDNEIRDYINRAPPRYQFNGTQIVWNTHSRFKWLTSIAQGSIHERINRRAGIKDYFEPWKQNPISKSSKRHRKNEFRKTRHSFN